MVAYYVTHPMMDKVAVVYAPSTEKARTTFLDWLERNGSIDRKYRQAWRGDMVAKRLGDPNVPADVELHYGYEEVAIPQEYRLGRPGIEETPVTLEEPQVEEIPTGFEEPETRDEFIPLEEPRPKRMPIQEVMLRGF